MAAYRRVDTLKLTCGLTACTPGSASGPTVGNDYGRTLPFLPSFLVASSPRPRRHARHPREDPRKIVVRHARFPRDVPATRGCYEETAAV